MEIIAARLLTKLPDFLVHRFNIPKAGSRKDQDLDMTSNKGQQMFWEQIKSENILFLNASPDISVTVNVSGHTPVMMENPLDENGIKVPAHLLTWNNTITSNIGPDGLKKDIVEPLSVAVLKSINYLSKKTGSLPVVFQLSGYPGAQSVPLTHLHAVVLPKLDGEKTTPLVGQEKLKYFSPMSVLMTDIFRDLSEELVETSNNSQIQISAVESTNNPMETGIKIELKSTSELEEYLTLIYKLVGKLNSVYKEVYSCFESLYLADKDKQNGIIASSVTKLNSMGLSPDMSQKIINKGYLFKPTLRQVESWLMKDDLSEDVREKLTKTRKAYLRHKERNSNPDYRLRQEKSGREHLLKFSDDLLLSEGEGKPETLLPKNLSLKIFTDDYTLSSDGSVNVRSFNVSLLLIPFRGGNTVEVMTQSILNRQ